MLLVQDGGSSMDRFAMAPSTDPLDSLTKVELHRAGALLLVQGKNSG